MLSIVLLFIAGLIILTLGAELLVRGSSRFAAAVGVSPLVIGLTVVALGTASPEIAVSLQSAVSGEGEITLGNLIGSNIFNILFVLGVSALFAPLLIAEQLIRLDAPIMVGVSLLTYLLAADGRLGKLDSVLLLGGVVAYTLFSLYQSGRESQAVQQEYAQEYAQKEAPTPHNLLKYILLVAAGLGLLVLGARWLVHAATTMAVALGVSDLVIGLTIVAAGTSLPEVAASLVAARRGESDIAVGNAVGSNIYNLLGVLGVAGLVTPHGISIAETAFRFDFPVMISVAIVTLPIFYLDGRLSRFEGGLLFSYYLLYTAYLILRSSESAVLPALTAFALFYVPFTFLIVCLLALRSYFGKRRVR